MAWNLSIQKVVDVHRGSHKTYEETCVTVFTIGRLLGHLIVWDFGLAKQGVSRLGISGLTFQDLGPRIVSAEGLADDTANPRYYDIDIRDTSAGSEHSQYNIKNG